MTEGAKSRRMGLARALSKLGYCSRAAGFQLARAGRVRVNGVVRRDPESPVHLGKDRIEVDGRAVEGELRIYLVMNKARGVVTTASDERGRETVYAHLPRDLPWVAPVGRLDKASEGLLLLTNDSEWASTVTRPETHLEKTYHVQVGVVAGVGLVEAMVRGVKTEDGILRVKRAEILRGGEKNAWLEVVLDEGKNRQIRRVLEGLGVEVLRLVRVAIGPLKLGELQKGEVRRLMPAEKEALDRKMEKQTADQIGRTGRL
ncbi:MAG TPA: pseudouridine synthase [Terriglobales bacterium]|nr:pseudouridine synthase [Terriglobales bacterium]